MVFLKVNKDRTAVTRHFLKHSWYFINSGTDLPDIFFEMRPAQDLENGQN